MMDHQTTLQAADDLGIDEDIMKKENATDAPDKQNVQFEISLSGDDPEQPTASTAAHSTE